MSQDETVHVNPTTGALKAGNDERYDLIPSEPLRLLARHYGVGAKKYEDRNWEKGINWSLNFAALNRHLWQFWNGEDVDKETGSLHIIAVAWHAFALAEFFRTHPELDDRPNTKRNDESEPEGSDREGVSASDSELFDVPAEASKAWTNWTNWGTWGNVYARGGSGNINTRGASVVWNDDYLDPEHNKPLGGD